jgi:hypothetical protein
MPKLIIKKPKSTTSAEPKQNITEDPPIITNNNNDHDHDHDHDQDVAPTYEMLNPRYTNTNEDTLLQDNIRDRIGTYIEEPWTIIGSYFDGKHLEQLVRHQIESFNDMVNVQLKRTVDMFNPVKIASDQEVYCPWFRNRQRSDHHTS